MSSSTATLSNPAPETLPSGGFRLCLRNPALLARWFLSRRIRHAVEVRKHVWKIRCFQRDELSATALAGIDAGLRDFDEVLRKGPNPKQLADGISALDEVAQKWLRPYANAALRENVEVFLVAIAVAMAIRTFFLQPFKIPTGSMQPTLYGVHFEDLRDRSDVAVPGLLGRIGAALFKGDYYHVLVAEADGEVLRVEPHKSVAFISYQDVVMRYRDGGRNYEKTHRIWFSPVDGHDGDLRHLASIVGWNRPEPFIPLSPGQPFKKGEVLLRLKDSAGDHLFVDRVTYNFRPPRRGEIIVFETRGIRALPQDQFYIKRLVALGGETVRLGDDRHLVINGQRLDGTTPHFEKVYGKMGPPAESQYSGHVNGTIAETTGRDRGLARYFLNNQAEVNLPKGRYMVMGDNTLNSYDSRGWGDFAQTNVVGRYCFVWWPFTDRWGTRPN
ncbi:MAG: signal peptidase I [Verrucomicrobiales bacterium]|nr:signal peptidase I [Verrucomicrobiales bacterium]